MVMEQQAHHRKEFEGPRRLLSAFRPILGRRDLISFVPRPGLLPRNLHAQMSRDKAEPCPPSSCGSLFTRRNAITSSYSSPGGLPGLRRKCPAISHTRLLPGSSKDPRENSFQSLCSVPEVSKKTKYKKVADTTSRQTESWRNCVCTTNSAGSRKRKIPLPRRRQGDPLMLPPPAKLSYQVTAEHIA